MKSRRIADVGTTIIRLLCLEEAMLPLPSSLIFRPAHVLSANDALETKDHSSNSRKGCFPPSRIEAGNRRSFDA